MPLTNANLLADDLLALWLIENSPIKVPFYQAWAWQSVAGRTLIYPRTTELAQANVIAACTNVGEQEPTVSQAAFDYVEYITRYQICASDLDRFQYPQRLDSVLFALAKRRILYAYAQRMGTATGNPATGGLPDLVDPARVIDMGGVALTLDCLDQAYELVTAGTGRPTLIMSHSRSLRMYRKLCRDTGIPAERAPWRWYDPAKGAMVDGSVDAFNGTPWLANDKLNEPGEVSEERIFFMVVGDDGGPSPTRGVTGIVPSAIGRDLFVKRTVNAIPDPTPGSADHIAGQDTWVTMPAGLALGSQGALSIIQNFTTVAPCGVDAGAAVNARRAKASR